ncbi:MAG: NUDIX hydrolase [Actinomycetota bacterium]
MSTDDPTLNFITPRVAAGVLFTDDQDRVLMVVPSYKDYLDIPGGYVENGETPHQAAQREVYEELGIKSPIGGLLVADWWEDSPEANGGAKLLLIFDGDQLDEAQMDDLRPDGNEVVGFELIPQATIADRTISRLANRIGYALMARGAETMTYLENGLQARQ